MMTAQEFALQDLNIRGTSPLVSPRELLAEYRLTDKAARLIHDSRQVVRRIMTGKDPRLMVIVGPCSIHSQQIAMDYARRLKQLADEVSEQLFVIMRVYFEKPRTTVGWKGLINDPHLNDTFDMSTGLQLARRILLDVNEVGVPAATEMLEPITPQYISDLITTASIGARTTESPTHRQMASGLSMPVGFKNSTEGSMEVAVNAMKAALAEHSFLGIDHFGKTCIVNTQGNDMVHLILRGGRQGPNYDRKSLAEARELLNSAGVPRRIMIDCSHANSGKKYDRQHMAWNDVIDQRAEGNTDIVGLMLESNLKAGNQPLTSDPSQLEYGVSITDGCISFEETERLLRDACEKLS